VRNTINYEEREVADEDEANKVLKEVKEKVEELKKIAEEPTEDPRRRRGGE
jgi:translation initiation factor IF-3